MLRQKYSVFYVSIQLVRTGPVSYQLFSAGPLEKLLRNWGFAACSTVEETCLWGLVHFTNIPFLRKRERGERGGVSVHAQMCVF